MWGHYLGGLEGLCSGDPDVLSVFCSSVAAFEWGWGVVPLTPEDWAGDAFWNLGVDLSGELEKMEVVVTGKVRGEPFGSWCMKGGLA